MCELTATGPAIRCRTEMIPEDVYGVSRGGIRNLPERDFLGLSLNFYG